MSCLLAEALETGEWKNIKRKEKISSDKWDYETG